MCLSIKTLANENSHVYDLFSRSLSVIEIKQDIFFICEHETKRFDERLTEYHLQALLMLTSI